MHRRSIVQTVLLTLALPVVLAGPAIAQSGGRTFTAALSGGEEVPAVETTASGAAEFVLGDDGGSLSFTLDVDGLENTTMAHIHLAPAGENGPPVVWLHTQEGAPELVPGVFSGTLASGTITADDLVGPLEGATLDDLVVELAAGNTYVNVHTEEFPDGEVRGQIAELAAAPDEGADEEAGDDGAAVEQPTRVDTGAGGTATGASATSIAAGFAALLLLGLLAVRRRESAS